MAAINTETVHVASVVRQLISMPATTVTTNRPIITVLTKMVNTRCMGSSCIHIFTVITLKMGIAALRELL